MITPYRIIFNLMIKRKIFDRKNHNAIINDNMSIH